MVVKASKKARIVFSILIVLLVSLVIFASSSATESTAFAGQTHEKSRTVQNMLDGVWVYNGLSNGSTSGSHANRTSNEQPFVIEFSGNTFSMKQKVTFINAFGVRKMNTEIYDHGYFKITDSNWNNAEKRGVDSHGMEIRYVTVKGTYSITDDQIEFIYPDNDIRVKEFSRTANTMIIDYDAFVRRLN